MKVPFSLFTNDRKTGNQPDYRSMNRFPIIITEPGEYRVAGWKRLSKNNDEFIYCVLEKVELNPEKPPSREDNLAMLEKTRKALEEAAKVDDPPKRAAYRPQPTYNPPPEPEDDLPF